MINKIENHTSVLHCVNCNPLINVFHDIELSASAVMSTGQPLTVFFEDRDKLSELMYDVYNENGEEPNVPSDIIWSVGYTEEGSTTVADILNDVGFLIIKPIKHPDRDEWAIPFSQKIFDEIPDGDTKDTLGVYHVTSVTNGNSKSKSEMLLDGWVY